MRYLAKALFLLIAVALLVTAALAQRESGVITGAVTDPSGAVVGGAKVSAKSVTTGVVRDTVTDAAGIYSLPALKPDTYMVTIEAPNFKKFARQVVLSVGSTLDVSTKLEVGATSEVVEVSGIAAAAAVNTENQTLSQVITSRQLNDLPTDPTRNPYALVGTSGGVTEDCSSNRGASSMGCGYSINGLRSASTDILLDGGENVDNFTATVGQQVPLDSVQEFSVLTNNFTSEYGRASGGVVNVVTKSGTNAFHGSAYEFNRVSALSSNTYENNATDTPKGIFTRNDFGFSVGGPVKKDKLFFFNNTEWVRVRSAAPTEFTIIDPGSYASLAPASQAFFSQYGKLASGLTTKGQGPCGSLTCDLVSFAVPSDAGGGSPQNTWMEVARVDYNFSDKTTLTGRYASYNELDFPGTVSNSPYAGYNTGQKQYDQNAQFSLTHVFSPTFVNTAKAVYNRLNGPTQSLGSAPVGPTLYTTSGVPAVLGEPLIYPGYLPDGPGEAIPFGGPQNLYEFYDDASWTHGKHQFKFGGEYINLRDNRVFGAYLNAVEILGPTTAQGLADLVSGQIYQFDSAVYPQGKYPCPKNINGVTQVSPSCTVSLPITKPDFERNYHYNDLAFYGQDSWKIKPRLTLSGGVRWEYYGVQHNANPALDSNFVLGPGATIFDQIRNGQVELAQDGGIFWRPRYGNFGPRVGFAWDIFGNGKTSLRGGYGISYERNFGNVTYNAIQNPPNYAVINLQSSAITGTGDLPFMPVYTDNNGPLGGNSGSKALPAVSQRAINQNMATAYAETWNLTIDRQLTTNSVLSLSYAGSHGVHLYDIAQVNLVGAGAAYLGDANASNRLNLQYGAMNYRSDEGYSHYNGLNVGFRANNLLSKGLSFTANYTWSHALDNLSSTFSDSNQSIFSGAYSLGYLDPFNPKLNYGNSDYDIRHRFVMSGSWEVPWMKNASSAVERYALGGWIVGLTFNLRSGAPFSIYDCSNFNGQDCPLYASPSVLPSSGSGVPAGVDYSPNTFNYITLPSTGCPGPSCAVLGTGVSLGIPSCTGLDHTGTCTYTTTGQPYPERNQFFGPGYWNINMNFFKNFRITERFQLQFRSEMYNIFNHSNMYVNTTNIDAASLLDNNGNSSQYIQAEKGGPAGFAGTTTDERRNIQLGLRLTF